MTKLPDVLRESMDMWDYKDGVPTANETATDEVKTAVEQYAILEAETEDDLEADL